METISIVGYIACGAFLFLGLIFLLIGLVFKKSSEEKRIKCTEKTTAKIKDIKSDYFGDALNEHSYVSYFPVIEYNIENKNYVRKYDVGFKKNTYEIGDEVEILYNPEEPNEFYFAGDKTSAKIGELFPVLGGGFLTLGVIILILTIIYN